MRVHPLISLIALAFTSCLNSFQKSESYSAHEVQEAELSFERVDSATESNRNPIWGHRFLVVGDFDGNGNTDTLMERYFSLRDGEETNKYYGGAEWYAENFDSAAAKCNLSYAICSSPSIDTFCCGGVIGFLSLRNEWDLDGDGGDELSMVRSKRQQSSMNTCDIYSFKQNRWRKMGSFEMREWQLPPMPQAGPMWTNLGVSSIGQSSCHDDDVALQRQLQQWPGLIRRLEAGRIVVQAYNNEIMEEQQDTILLAPMEH